MEAAAIMLRQAPMVCLPSYIHRAEYLRRLGPDAPTESEVMAECIRWQVPTATVKVWSGDEEGPSNTQAEVRSILEYASLNTVSKVTFLTIQTHTDRVRFWADYYANTLSRGGASTPEYLVVSSESVIGAASPSGQLRVNRLVSSEAFRRSIEVEREGLQAARSRVSDLSR